MSEIKTLGPVGLNPLGNYNSQTEYEKLDVVLYQGSSYVALKPVQGIAPTNPEYWQKLVSGGVSRDEVPLIFNTVAEMKSAEDLVIEDTVQTLGYYGINDGGGAIYKITDEESQTDYQEELENGLYATLIIEDFINIKQYGAYGDGIHDDIQAIQKAIDDNPLSTIYFPKGTYGLNDSIVIYQANNYGVNLELDKEAILKSISSNKISSIIEVGRNTSKGTYSRRSANNMLYIHGGIIDCTNVENGVILNSGRQLVQMFETSFKNITDVGLFLEKNNTYTSGDFKISYCNFFKTNSDSGIGIKVHAYDNELIHIRIDGCQTAVETLDGFQTYDDIHCTALYGEGSTDETKQATIGFNFTGGSASMINCYADTYATGFKFTSDGNYLMNNCVVYYYNAFNQNINIKCVDITNDNVHINIMNSKFRINSNVGTASFINVNKASYYANCITNDNIHLYNNLYNNTNNKVSYTDLAYCLPLNNKLSITPYYAGQTFTQNNYYYLCSVIVNSTLNCPTLTIRNSKQVDVTIRIEDTNTIQVLHQYNSFWRTWKFALVKGELITFDNGTTIQLYDLYAQIGNQDLSGNLNLSISYDSYNNPLFSYRKLTPSAVQLSDSDILSSVTINQTT